MRTTRLLPAVLGLGLTTLAACGNDLEVAPIYDPATGRILVLMNRDLEDGETLHVQARRGSFGQLDCASLAPTLEPLTESDAGRHFGPVLDQSLLRPFYGPEWAFEPTPEMLAALEAGTDSIIDVCLMKGSEVVVPVEADLFEAVDRGRREGLGGKADDQDSGEQRITSPQAYGERCIAELGDIPFFEKIGDGNYGTYNCLDSTPIPMTVTDGGGNVDRPEGTVGQCDKPQYIYSLCEQGPRVAQRVNEDGTRWVLLCRKSLGGLSSDQYNDIAMIGTNPFTGKTCFFQNALYSKTDGGHVPHPADVEKSKNLWSGVHGGLGGGIECTRCHSADAFVHSPWIDGAKDQNGRPVISKIGVDEDFPTGANDTPYSLVNARGQGWTFHEMITDERAAACTKCHRMGKGDRWAGSWLARLEQTDGSWENITTAHGKKFENARWMPPELGALTASTWAGSPEAAALTFIKGCSEGNTDCQSAPIPSMIGGEGGGGKLRNPVDLPDTALAQQSLELLTVGKCADCHAVTRRTLREWHELTVAAEDTCLAESSGGAGEPVTRSDDQSLAQGEFKAYGPYEVASGGTFTAKLTGTGDADLYVKKGAEASTTVYDCRPYGGTSNEECGPGQFGATGPGLFYVGVNGYKASEITLEVSYTAPGGGGIAPADVVKCAKLDPENPSSPFYPAKVGIYSAAAHLGWFQDVFKSAYPVADHGANKWVIEYAKFKSRVSMPKGNNPRWSQDQFDIVAEWFARGLPQLDAQLPEDPPPTSCTPFVSSTMSSHVSTMASQGWGAVNRDRGMQMFGCTGADPLGCLSSFARASSKPYGSGWENVAGAKLRVLRELDFKTFYWARSSPDGRFVGNGDATSGQGSRITDLQTGVDIPTEAAYDPGFYPDGSGWIFQGTPIGTAFCTNSLLSSGPAQITFSEPQCSSINGVALYQHLGTALGGGDYFTINGQFTSDNGGHGKTLKDPSAGFASSAQIKLTPMAFDGNHYVAKPQATVASPFEGDNVLSPSTRLVVSRLAGPNAEQLGYTLRRVNATANGSGYNVTTTEVGRYCVKGAKAGISFDERFLVTHHYVEAGDFAELGYASASDPEFVALRDKGAANIILVDLLTGTRTRVTTMKAGQYALFPHFRSDNWIYFLVRDNNTGKDLIVASDAALVLAQ